MSRHHPDSKADSKTAEPPAITPGRPKESGSRQQTQPDQRIQSGSADLDKEMTQNGGAESPPIKPAGAR